MTEHDEQAPDEQVAGDEQQAPSGDAQSTPEANVDRSAPDHEPAAEATSSEDEGEQEHEVVEDEVVEEAADDEAIVDLDHDADATPADAVAESLREALGTMREEADRIAALGTGEEQVEAAEQFAEDAGTLDEQVGAAARQADAEH